MEDEHIFMETTDVSRVTGLSLASVRRIVANGTLQPAARTVRGGRLFLPEDVDRVTRERDSARRSPVDRKARGSESR